eukprot:SM000079S22495  [mRNA]  locus=s79:496836:500980:+ [translate_table: standard]
MARVFGPALGSVVLSVRASLGPTISFHRLSLLQGLSLLGAALQVLLLCTSLGYPVLGQTWRDLACTSTSFTERPCRFVDALPRLPKINTRDHPNVTLGAYKIAQKLHRDLPATTLYGYGTSLETASSPGPTLEAVRGYQTTVHWQNHLTDDQHLFVVDPTLMVPKYTKGGIPMVPHLHGIQSASESDGHPNAWWTPFNETGDGYVTTKYEYPNKQEPALLWYHDHTVGMTRLNVQAGLTGAYVLRDPEGLEKDMQLPSGKYEHVLVLQDKWILDNGTMYFNTLGDVPSAHPNWVPEFFGETMVVNGKAWPYLKVQPKKYRFRIVNAANARFFNLYFGNSMTFFQIGSDGGYLPQPVLTKSLLIAPGERADIVVNFGLKRKHRQLLLKNDANTPYPGGDPVTVNSATIMKFVIAKKVKTPDNSVLGKVLRPALPVLKSLPLAEIRQLTLTETEDVETDEPLFSLLNGLHWDDPVTEKPKQGTTEVWQIINLTDDMHPIHLHLVQFQAVQRQIFDTDKYPHNCTLEAYGSPQSASSCYLAPPTLYPEAERGWKDTLRMAPGEVSTIAIRFTDQEGKAFSFNVTDGPGYVWHCHILDHEDNDMMRPYVIVP